MGMSAPPIGMISRTPNTSDKTHEDREQPGSAPGEDQRDADDNGQAENAQIDDVLAAIGDGPRGQNLLQLSEGHQARGEGQKAEQVSTTRATITKPCGVRR